MKRIKSPQQEYEAEPLTLWTLTLHCFAAPNVKPNCAGHAFFHGLYYFETDNPETYLIAKQGCEALAGVLAEFRTESQFSVVSKAHGML